jgi:hypothetical protein
MKNNKFLQDQVSLLALKKRIREKARSRRFEITALKKHEVNKHKDSRKLTEHAKASAKKREPGLKKLVEKYNKGCKELVAQIKKRKFPVGGRALNEINMDHIWELDVDDPIWQDVEVQDDEEFSIPDWIGDELTCQAICNRVENQCCEEELLRIQIEVKNLQTWLAEEWNILALGMTAETPEYMAYQMEVEQQRLLRLGGGWWKNLHDLPGIDISAWFPTAEKLEHAWEERKTRHVDLVGVFNMTSTDEEENSEESVDDENSEESREDFNEESDENISAALYELEIEQLTAEYYSLLT